MSIQPNIYPERISGTTLDGVTNIYASTISATTYYGDGSNILNVTHSFTGTSTLNFGASISGETNYTTTAITNSNINQFSNVIVKFTPSTNHSSLDDSIIEGIIINQSDIVDGVGFNINAYSSEGTWGIYNINYRIVN